MSATAKTLINKLPLRQISVIIPTLNEASRIQELLAGLRSESQVEIIVVDGKSSDQTAMLAEDLADQVLITDPGRGQQLNAGAKVASAEFLWFLHADSKITKGSINAILESFHANQELVGGAFRLKFDHSGFSLRLIAFGANLRSLLFKQPWGDQGIFVRKNSFEQLSGFPDWPIMEDLEFMRRLARTGPVTLLPMTIQTSSRRYKKLGILKTMTLNFRILWWFKRGYSIEEIQKRFRPLHEQGGNASS